MGNYRRMPILFTQWSSLLKFNCFADSLIISNTFHANDALLFCFLICQLLIVALGKLSLGQRTFSGNLFILSVKLAELLAWLSSTEHNVCPLLQPLGHPACSTSPIDHPQTSLRYAFWVEKVAKCIRLVWHCQTQNYWYFEKKLEVFKLWPCHHLTWWPASIARWTGRFHFSV